MSVSASGCTRQAASDKLAETICYEENPTGDSHWITSAKLLISGIIGALAKYGARADMNVIAVRTIITGANGQSVFEFCRERMKLNDPYIRQERARFAVVGEPAIPGQSAGKPGAEERRELNSAAARQTRKPAGSATKPSRKASRAGMNELSFKDLLSSPPSLMFDNRSK